MKLKRHLLVIPILVISAYPLYGWSISHENNHQPDNVMYMYSMKAQPDSQNGQTETETLRTLNIPGDYLKAAMVAGQAFQEYLHEEWRNNFSPVAPHLSDISNYSIAVSRESKGGKYKIEFSPEPFQDSPIKGGGATYVIDGQTFRILKKEYSM